MAAWGKWIAIAGAAVLIFIVLLTGASVARQSTKPCDAFDPKTVADKAIVASPQTEIDVNGRLCVAWKPKGVFAAETLTAAARKIAADAATEAADKARDDLAKVPATDTAGVAAATTRLKQAQTVRDDAKAQADAVPKSASLVLFIDGKPSPIGFPAQITDSDDWVLTPLELRAPTDASSDDAKTWRTLLSSGSKDGARAVEVSLGDKDAKFPRDGTKITGMKLRVMKVGWVVAGGVAFLAMVVGLIMWGWNTPMLRDRAPVAGTVPPDKPPFSLGRVQMAWWFFLSLAGFLFIWMLSGQWSNVMTMSVVALVGISGATGAAAMAIDGPAAAGQPPPQSKDFLRDITSSGDGVVLHRVQMLVWTVVMGLIFAWSVVWTFSFPAFDNAMLVLAGLVNGVYVGFKFPEKAAPP
jgi:hypothetical protein